MFILMARNEKENKIAFGTTPYSSYGKRYIDFYPPEEGYLWYPYMYDTYEEAEWSLNRWKKTNFAKPGWEITVEEYNR